MRARQKTISGSLGEQAFLRKRDGYMALAFSLRKTNKERHLNNVLIWGTANKREYSLVLKFAFIGVHSRFEIWASYLSDNPKLPHSAAFVQKSFRNLFLFRSLK
ncbi:hypothetical protein EDS67_23835 [candidate division KSB1 bacterium]|nr:MAG: hypothetical protein EDS67_23835 [candidate division KSB1 bacterium]MBC6951366.1 hypothetical protein [candidate division KSB1 bacterium]MCE7944237.1 hypothetical protein [Chlorobi bacterium CHB1]MDL1876995.1 hypothetical protein [Cytophagia bacterium CHB2]